VELGYGISWGVNWQVVSGVVVGRWNVEEPAAAGPWQQLTVLLRADVKHRLAEVAKAERRTMSAQAGIYLARALGVAEAQSSLSRGRSHG
jgi:hypothetical protein